LGFPKIAERQEYETARYVSISILCEHQGQPESRLGNFLGLAAGGMSSQTFMASLNWSEGRPWEAGSRLEIEVLEPVKTVVSHVHNELSSLHIKVG